MEESFCLSFSLCPGIGPKRFLQLLAHFGTAEKAWSATFDALRPFEIGEITYKKFDNFRKSFNEQEYQEKLERAKVNVIAQCDKLYPGSLRKIPDPPIVLFAKGYTQLLRGSDKNIAVVGTRTITSYGREVTEKLVSGLALNGFTVISGLAMGVDATAHKTALENNGATIAVLGCGVDCCTPRENQRLYEEILDSGSLILSEYPLGEPPNKGTFPARNRIIAALSNGVLVTEAGADSGSLITAALARDYKKPVFSVPGPITPQLSRGTTFLLKSGAKLVTSVQDLLEELGQTEKTTFESVDISAYQGSPDEKQILRALQGEALTMDELSKKTAIPIMKLSVIVSGLELKDIIKNQSNAFSLK